MRRAATASRAAGFTLVECAAACAIVGVLAAAAIGSFHGRQLRVARLDAVAALTRVQAEQEKHRDAHGLYAGELAALRGVAPTSAQGRYTLAVSVTGADRYRATATARGAQQNDRDCPALTLEVASGFATHGPAAACWMR